MKNIILFSCLLMAGSSAFPQRANVHDRYISDTALPRLRIERAMIYAPGDSWLYNHHASIALVLSTSKDGKNFDRSYLIADQPYTLKKEGLWKDGQYGYPHTLIDNGYLYIIISRQKEAIECIRLSIAQN